MRTPRRTASRIRRTRPYGIGRTGKGAPRSDASSGGPPTTRPSRPRSGPAREPRLAPWTTSPTAPTTLLHDLAGSSPLPACLDAGYEVL